MDKKASMIVEAGRKRIKDRGINWGESYHTRSKKLKDRFEEKIGPFSYMRWEGHDYTTNSDYFVVVSPSLTKDGDRMFFAGIKKLPDDPKSKVYAPYGEYFSTIDGAFSYAFDKWGVPFPSEAPHYGYSDLAGVDIPRHVKADKNLKTKKISQVSESSQSGDSVVKDNMGINRDGYERGNTRSEVIMNIPFFQSKLSECVTSLTSISNNINAINKNSLIEELGRVELMIEEIKKEANRLM